MAMTTGDKTAAGGTYRNRALITAESRADAEPCPECNGTGEQPGPDPDSKPDDPVKDESHGR